MSYRYKIFLFIKIYCIISKEGNPMIEMLKNLFGKKQDAEYVPDPPGRTHPISAHVAFQKEVLAEKWNMVHVTEISFTVYRADFDKFEKMSGVSLTDDFRDLSSTTFNGKDRRKDKRDT